MKCIFEKLEKARATTKKIEDITELEGWEELQDEDKELINKHVSGIQPLLPLALHSLFSFASVVTGHMLNSLSSLTELAAKANATPKKKVQAKLSNSGQLSAPLADPTVNAPRKFSGFTGTTLREVSF